MDRAPEVTDETTNNDVDIPRNGLKGWLSSHRIAAFAIALVALTLALTAVTLFLNRKSDALDPQEQIGVRWIKPPGSEAAYAGNQACKSCHPREFQLYSTSPHARTLHAIPPDTVRPEFGSTQTVSDDQRGIIYSVQKSEGKNQFVATMGTKTELGVARWIFGSGTQAWTYLGQTGSRFGQFRITYYPPSETWNFTPGSGPGAPFHQALGDPYTAGQAAACFGCHSTVLIGSRKQLDLAHSVLNVGCESCHGPCRIHIESVTSGSASPHAQTVIVKPPLHNGSDSMQLCGACHRVPVGNTDENAAGGTQLARFPGIALPRSRCFIASAGKLSCVTCHDPHQSARQQQEISFDNKCISCHSAPHGTTCSRGETSACVSCHMPVEQIARKLPLRFHNHWIRKDPNGFN